MIASFRALRNHGTFLNDTAPQSRPAPVIVTRSDHNISRANISPNALKVLYRLRSAGFGAFLVGGGVRDLLLGLHPKDFDVVTDAEMVGGRLVIVGFDGRARALDPATGRSSD